jgi:hypothetical protein
MIFAWYMAGINLVLTLLSGRYFPGITSGPIPGWYGYKTGIRAHTSIAPYIESRTWTKSAIKSSAFFSFQFCDVAQVEIVHKYV